MCTFLTSYSNFDSQDLIIIVFNIVNITFLLSKFVLEIKNELWQTVFKPEWKKSHRSALKNVKI